MIVYIVKNRFKPKLFTFHWAKTWLKRAYNLIPLLKLIFVNYFYIICGAKIGNGTIVKTKLGAVNCNKITIGDNSYLDKSATIALHDRVTIGNNVVINSGVNIITATHNLYSPDWEHIKKPIVIEDFAWVSTRSMILPGVHIGYGAVIGAGAVVRKDVPAYSIVAGNPATVVGRRNEKLNYNPNEMVSYLECWLNSNKDL